MILSRTQQFTLSGMERDNYKKLVDGGQTRQSLVMCRADERVAAAAQMIRHHSRRTKVASDAEN